MIAGSVSPQPSSTILYLATWRKAVPAVLKRSLNRAKARDLFEFLLHCRRSHALLLAASLRRSQDLSAALMANPAKAPATGAANHMQRSEGMGQVTRSSPVAGADARALPDSPNLYDLIFFGAE